MRIKLDRKFQPLVFADAAASIVQEGMIGAKVVEIDFVGEDARRGGVCDVATLADVSGRGDCVDYCRVSGA